MLGAVSIKDLFGIAPVLFLEHLQISRSGLRDSWVNFCRFSDQALRTMVKEYYKIDVMKSGKIEVMGSYDERMAKKRLVLRACHREKVISLSNND
jgi:hypothetical protein